MLNYSPNVSTKDSRGETIEDLALVLKALSHHWRLKILNLLMEGVQCNCEISQRLGLSLNLISHHMRILREAGLVQSERDVNDARWIYYSIDKDEVQDLAVKLSLLLDVSRIQPRSPSCGPQCCDTSHNRREKK